MKNEKLAGIMSTACIIAGAPLVAFLVQSVIGWLVYTAGSIAGLYYAASRRDRVMIIQFAYYLAWNLVAIITRI